MALAMRPLAEGRYDEASPHLADAVQANPNFPSTRFFRSITLALSGRKEDARREMAVAVAMSPATTTRLLRAIGLPSELADKMAVGGLVAGMPE